jgi:hypothetical protein
VKNVAVEGATVTFEGAGLTDYGAVTISGSYSDNVVIDGKKVLADKVTGTCASMSFSGGYTSVEPVRFEIKSSSLYAIADKKNVILEGDESDPISVQATNGETTSTFSVIAKVSDSGQTNVTAE